ncbi:uncharacterized protein CDAR_462941 [Caerostris darwini]|uniref:Uncharacterized protein n=1 Tax=Caerostris darwini TaxID=1538125 RepID=A0AAV4Q8L6_9ARAC|nr:uncharacterized protein CDAR_462941 [Caerostris darwini]
MEVGKILRKQNIDLKTDVFLKYLATYESTVRILKSVERVMSFPIFLVAITDCTNMFNGFLWLDPFKQIKNISSYNKHSLSTLFMSLRAVASFLCVSLAASGVHEAIKSSQEVQKQILTRLLASGIERNSKDMLLLFVSSSSSPFCLTGWGFFHFTKGFVLTAIGSILTYSLLILQID